MIKPILYILILSDSWLLERNMPSPAAPRPNRQSLNTQVGKWGEQLVYQWLVQQQWQILARRWHCRWGEIDLIARSASSASDSYTNRLAFVEVKTRQSRNWDEDGRLAITQQKQQKLWKTAQTYLGKHPDLAELFCQFDVALVQCNWIAQQTPNPQVAIHDELQTTAIEIKHPIQIGGYQFMLLDYIESAFTL